MEVEVKCFDGFERKFLREIPSYDIDILSLCGVVFLYYKEVP